MDTLVKEIDNMGPEKEVKEVEIWVQRQESRKKKPSFKKYKVKVHPGMTVLDALLKIRNEQDETISFRYSCRSARCGSCSMRINNQPMLACYTQIKNVVTPLGQIIVSPMGNMKTEKDLIVDMDKPFWDAISRTRSVLVNKAQRDHKMSEENAEEISKLANCIMCGICYSDCTSKTADSEFIGPAAIASALRFTKDERDKAGKERTKEIQQDPGSFVECTQCSACTYYCPKGVDPSVAIEDTRIEASTYGINYRAPPLNMVIGANAATTGNIYGDPQETREDAIPEDARDGVVVETAEEGEYGYFAGCIQALTFTNVPENVARIFKEMGEKMVYFGKDEYCCSFPLVMSGQMDLAKDVMLKNIKMFNKKKVKKLITTCSKCWWVLDTIYKKLAKENGIEYDMEVTTVADLAYAKMKDGKLKFKKPINANVTYHDPCHLAREKGQVSEPRELISAIEGVTVSEMNHTGKDGMCCGVPTTGLRDPEMLEKIQSKRWDEIKETNAEIMATSCGPCQVAFAMGNKGKNNKVRITDLTDLIIEGLGLVPKDDKGRKLMDARLELLEGLREMFAGMTPQEQDKTIKDTYGIDVKHDKPKPRRKK